MFALLIELVHFGEDIIEELIGSRRTLEDFRSSEW
jgi:hypothetical protein